MGGSARGGSASVLTLATLPPVWPQPSTRHSPPVQVAEHADEVFARMDAGAHMYFCGLKGMMPGITEMLQRISEAKGLVWEDRLHEWKANGQWHVEVY